VSETYQWIVELHQADESAFRAVIAGTMVSAVCGVMGCFIILRRTAFLADAVAHSMLAGVVAGYLLMQFVIGGVMVSIFGDAARSTAMLIGATLAGLITVALVGYVSKMSRVKEDAVIGLMYTAVFSLGGVFASYFSKYIHLDLYHFLIGDLIGVALGDLWMIAVVLAVVLATVICLFRPLQLISFDPVMASSIGVSVMTMEYVLTVCTAMVVVAGVTMVGVVMVVGLLIIPAATAYLLCDRLSRMLPLAALFGVTGFALGYGFSLWLKQIAPGAAIVLACAGQFSIAFFFAPKYGVLADWLRRRRIVPQQQVEDVLGSILRSPKEQALISQIVGHVEGRAAAIRRAIRSLERQDLLEVQGDTLTLTDAGRHEARRLLRAHRLWESYLAHVGAPEEELHPRAHQLEHVHDEQAVDYLDDKLGHPTHDPHGSVIPEDFVHLEPGVEAPASLLREGHRAVITALGSSVQSTPLEVGMEITAGQRKDDGQLWQLILPDGQVISLDHDQADAVTVRV